MRGVKPDVRGEINRLAAAIRRACPPTHRVFVTVVPNPALEGEDGGYGFGLFQWPTAGPRRPQAMRIGVAAGLADLIEEQLEEPRPQAVRDVCESFLHEWVHYEQWRAGRECTERGVRVRARNLYERFTPADPDTDRPRTRSATADGPKSGGT